MSQFAFLNTEALQLLWGVALAASVIWYGLKLRSKRELLFGLKQRSHHKLLGLIGVTTLILLSLALTRPYKGYQEIEIKSSGSDTMLVVDISSSMLTKDLSPSRLEYTKRKILDLTEYLARERSGDRIGLTLFAGESYQFCPLTSDYGALRQFAKSISPDLISMPGSNLTSAIIASVASFKSAAALDPSIILFSDGEDSRLDLEQAIGAAKEAKIPISVLGIGTTEGMPIEQSSGEFIKDSRGQIVVSKLIEQPLIELARRSGGLYKRSSLGDSDIMALLPPPKASLNSQQADSERRDKIRIYNEVGTWAIWGAALLFAIYFAIARRLGALMLALFISVESARAEPTTFDGYRAYEQGRYEEALKAFESEYKRAPENLKNIQALASTLYKLERFKEAASHFEELESKSREGKRAYEANFNLGNAHLKEKRLQEAIAAYDKALKIKPADEPATFNKKIAEQLLIEEQKKQQQQQKNEDQDKKESKEQEQNQEQSSDKNKDNQEQQQSENNSQEQSPKSDEQNQEPQEANPEQNDKKDGAQKENQEHPAEQQSESKAENSEQKEPPQNNQEQESKEENLDKNIEQGSEQELAEKLSKQEAEAWIQSLPESPALLHTKRRYGKPMYEQTW